MQLSPIEHETGHEPQFCSSVLRFASQVSGSASQSAKPDTQAPKVQLPELQPGIVRLRDVASVMQLFMHVPQRVTVLIRLVSQPAAAVQSPNPASHETMHIGPGVAWHIDIDAPGIIVQSSFDAHVPHVVSLVRSVSQPFAALPSQLPNMEGEQAPKVHARAALHEVAT